MVAKDIRQMHQRKKNALKKMRQKDDFDAVFGDAKTIVRIQNKCARCDRWHPNPKSDDALDEGWCVLEGQVDFPEQKIPLRIVCCPDHQGEVVKCLNEKMQEAKRKRDEGEVERNCKKIREALKWKQ